MPVFRTDRPSAAHAATTAATTPSLPPQTQLPALVIGEQHTADTARVRRILTQSVSTAPEEKIEGQTPRSAPQPPATPLGSRTTLLTNAPQTSIEMVFVSSSSAPAQAPWQFHVAQTVAVNGETPVADPSLDINQLDGFDLTPPEEQLD